MGTVTDCPGRRNLSNPFTNFAIVPSFKTKLLFWGSRGVSQKLKYFELKCKKKLKTQ
jgi:hypothetical protein